ncbi:hypothetical protein Acsp05_11100 [Actinokineospora sp. NBRC 105648]|nr:hypothetical protein Acsp05_11100 [Actinokineospora sp. NBRC 105648]
MCGSTRTWNGKRCRNPVSGRGRRCHQHTCLALFFRKARPDPVVPPQTPRTPPQPMRLATRTEGLRIATRDWRTAVADGARTAVDPETWTALLAADPATTCTRFAQLARTLADGDRQLIARLLDPVVSPGVVARVVAGQVTRRLFEVTSGAAHVELVVSALRVLGVYVCATGDRDLADCRCLRDMIDDKGLAVTKRALQEGLSVLA